MAESTASIRPFIFVLAGVNGGGKSSVGRALLAEQDLSWFTPVARAWEFGRCQLEAAMTNGTNYAFETTLGAKTIAAMLSTRSA